VYAVLAGESDDVAARRKLVEWIVGKGGRVTERDLYRAGPRQYRNDQEAARMALQALVEDRLGNWKTDTPDSGGRTRQVFVLATIAPKSSGNARRSSPSPESELEF
jgi:hypothetical protein